MITDLELFKEMSGVTFIKFCNLISFGEIAKLNLNSLNLIIDLRYNVEQDSSFFFNFF